jgi:HEAT repeat protein
LEFEIVNAASLRSLRTAFKDRNPFVRAAAARALGIREDMASAEALAELVKADPEYMVRIRAVEALGFLRVKPEVIELAKKDRQAGVQWAAVLAAGQLKSAIDYAAPVRQSYAAGIKREDMGLAEVGQPAPAFTAQTSDGKPFKLSAALGKRPLAIYFAAFDG